MTLLARLVPRRSIQCRLDASVALGSVAGGEAGSFTSEWGGNFGGRSPADSLISREKHQSLVRTV